MGGDSEESQEGQKKVAVIALVAVVGVLLVGIIMFSSMGGGGGDPKGWTTLFAALDQQDVENLEEVVDDFEKDKKENTLPNLWAKQSIGDMELSRGSSLVHSDRDAAKTTLKRALDQYSAVADSAGAGQMLKRRALYGKAATLECLAAVEKGHKDAFNECLKIYKDLAKDANNAIAKAAARRVEFLEQDGIREWYAWYQASDPKTSGIDDLNMPLDLESMPDRPKLDVPDFSAPAPLVPDYSAGGSKEVGDGKNGKKKDGKKKSDSKSKQKAGKKKAGKKKGKNERNSAFPGGDTKDKKGAAKKKAPAKKKAEKKK